MTQTPPQQYCLRWNNYQNNLTNVFDQLLQSEAFVDVTLACDGHSLKAHKMVLSACSPFFQTLFFDNPCSHPIVILKDINWDELKAVVEFMYRGEINVSQEQLAPLLKVAEMLKIRGLADVSRGSGGTNQGSRDRDGHNNERETSPASTGPHSRSGPNPADFLNTSTQDSEPESPIHANGSLLNHPLLQGHHLNPLNSLLNPNGSTPPSTAAMASLHRRKRRKMSTPERTPSPPEDDLDDHSSNQLEIDSQNGEDRASCSGEVSTNNISGGGGVGISMSLSSTPTPVNTPSLSVAASMGPAFLNLHAAAAAAAVANVGGGGSGSVAGGVSGGNTNNPSSNSSSLDLDLKPGIVEMIREEERAKMLESSHGWLGPSAASSLTDSYQYQIQNLWQKCWNQNQGGVVHALRFRERGPLKSWRPETMAEAIFAVLRDGLSLSQAARKYDIPYPTFVLYANRVHNMLGPSADGCSGTDLMSDMRPKGRGRPQRILLGTWPEEHIRGVIRAVVFRDTQSGKDEFPFIFNRETGLCLPPGSSHNGLDMSLQQFSNPFLNPNNSASTPSSGGNLLHAHHQLQPPQSSTPAASTGSGTSSSGGNSGSTGVQQNATNLSSSVGGNNNSSSNFPGVNLININEHSSAAAATAAALQHLQQLQQQGTLSASTTPGSPSSSSSSPLQQVLSSAGLLSTQAQRELFALQQKLQNQRRHSMSGNSRESRIEAASPLGLLNKKTLSSIVNDDSKDSPVGLLTDAEILQIKAELPASLSSVVGDEDEVEEEHNDDTDRHSLRGNRRKVDEQEDDNNHTGVIPFNEGDDEAEPFSTAFKSGVNNPGQSLGGGGGAILGSSKGCGGERDEEMLETGISISEEQQQARLQADFVKFLNRNSSNVISGNNGNSPAAASSNSPKNSLGSSDSNGNANSNNSKNNNNDSPKGSTSSSNNSNTASKTIETSSHSNNHNTLATATLPGHDGQRTLLMEDASTSRRASLRGSSNTGSSNSSIMMSEDSNAGNSVSSTCGTASNTSGISTRIQSAGAGRTGEREVNASQTSTS